jgi:hypothetical protein
MTYSSTSPTSLPLAFHLALNKAWLIPYAVMMIDVKSSVIQYSDTIFP